MQGGSIHQLSKVCVRRLQSKGLELKKGEKESKKKGGKIEKERIIGWRLHTLETWAAQMAL